MMLKDMIINSFMITDKMYKIHIRLRSNLIKIKNMSVF